MKLRMSYLVLVLAGLTLVVSCKKKGCTDPTATNYDAEAKKDDGNCEFSSVEAPYSVPSTYSFVDGDGNSTVSYSGQTERLSQLEEMTVYMKTGTTNAISFATLKDMFSNTGGNGNGAFSFSSTKQLQNKCFELDTADFIARMNTLAIASNDFSQTASSGQAGTLTSGTSTYLFDENGIEQTQIIEKGLMGAVFMYQALNVYLGDGKMDVDNTTAVDAAGGKYYTVMEHHWDENFGYFGVEPNFPAVVPGSFWGKYCNSQDATLGSNEYMMNAFLTGRAAISNGDLTTRDAEIVKIRTMWENISANQAITYIDAAISNLGSDNAKALHEIAEAYAFVQDLKYSPIETRRLIPTEVDALLGQFGTNFWNITVSDLNNIKSALQTAY